MTADIPADAALARFVVIGGGMGGVALIAAAMRSLHVAEVTSTVMVWRVERAGIMTLVTKWVITMRMILLQYYRNKVNNFMGHYLSGTAMCSIHCQLHLLSWKAQQLKRQNKSVTSARHFTRISSSPESSDSIRSLHVFPFL